MSQKRIEPCKRCGRKVNPQKIEWTQPCQRWLVGCNPCVNNFVLRETKKEAIRLWNLKNRKDKN